MSEQKLSERIRKSLDGDTLAFPIDEWADEVASLEAKLEEPARCNSGHETLPLKLWTCPTCHEELEAKLEAVEKERDAYKDLCTAYRVGSQSMADKALTALAAAQQEQSDD